MLPSGVIVIRVFFHNTDVHLLCILWKSIGFILRISTVSSLLFGLEFIPTNFTFSILITAHNLEIEHNQRESHYPRTIRDYNIPALVVK